MVAGRIRGRNQSSFDTEGVIGSGRVGDTEGREADATVMSSSRSREMRSSARVERLPWTDAVAVHLQYQEDRVLGTEGGRFRDLVMAACRSPLPLPLCSQ